MSPVCWDVILCRWINDSWTAKELSAFSYRVKGILQSNALCSLEKSLTICEMAQRHNLEKRNPQLHYEKSTTQKYDIVGGFGNPFTYLW